MTNKIQPRLGDGTFTFKSYDLPEKWVNAGGGTHFFSSEGEELRIQQIDDNIFTVSETVGSGIDHRSFDFFIADGKTAEEIEAAAAAAFNSMTLEILRQELADDSGNAELAAQVTRYERLVAAESQFGSIEHGDGEQYMPSVIGHAYADRIEVSRSSEGKLRITGGIVVNPVAAVGEEISGDIDTYLNYHVDAFEAWVKEKYGADVDGYTWEDVELQFTVEETDENPFPLTIEGAAERMEKETKIVELHNSLNGAYGNNSMYGFNHDLMIHLKCLDEAFEDEAYAVQEAEGEHALGTWLNKHPKAFAWRDCDTCDTEEPFSLRGNCLSCGTPFGE
ncbi:hypothetical protein [Leifsonia sp. Leaf264]|uniref:hypothetical protein n=1 Tax=Leifsonia sp. Leaf264 TaxID=1736314 RepID=UPI0006F7F18A|nr:hypothetical protein [Leifsonia sp. Leaf264]KQO98732.1 hypothetical protein ASF30_11770 [Leifsonia sp. Leaf264]